MTAERSLRLVHIAPCLGDEANGLHACVPRLCEVLLHRGHDLALLSLTQEGSPPAERSFQRTFDESLRLARLGLSEPLRLALDERAAGADVIHSHSLWRMPNVYAAWASARSHAFLVVSLHGALSPVALRVSSRRKRWFWRALQGPAVRRARLLHATSEQEYRDLRAFGLRQPVAIIPNGVDMPAPRPSPPHARTPGVRRLLYLGRLHPIKGLDDLIEAWRSLHAAFPDWEVRLVGPDEAGHGEALKRRAEALGLPRIAFVGPRYGGEKLAEYAAADLFVLPSHSENFCMSIAEALAMGRPVVTTTATPWGELPGKGAGWCVPPTAPSLGVALREALSLDRDRLAGMGERGRVWMVRDFAWDGVAGRMEAAYRWLIDGGPRPDFVRVD